MRCVAFPHITCELARVVNGVLYAEPISILAIHYVKVRFRGSGNLRNGFYGGQFGVYEGIPRVRAVVAAARIVLGRIYGA